MYFCATKLNNHMKRTFLLFIGVLTALMMTATQFTQEQAKLAAEQFVNQKSAKLPQSVKLKHCPSSKQSQQQPTMSAR